MAKRHGHEQSLFEHSLIELDVLLELLPVLERPQHYGLNVTEAKVLAVAVVIHDVGKETDAWQAYIRGNGPKTPHIFPDLTRTVVPELCAVLGFDDLQDPVQRITAYCAEFHHNKPGRSDGAILEAMLTGGSDRFQTLAHLVKAIDRFCSATNATEAVETIERDPALGHHLKITRHEVLVRGVSTTLLHRAAQTAFQQRRWKPLLYFSNATVYGADPIDNPALPAPEEVRNLLKAEINAAIARDVTPLMVGSSTGNILPKPDLFAFTESKQYLKKASQKIGPQSFAKKPLRAKRKVVEDYWKLKGRSGTPTDGQVEEEAQLISVAQPEMLVFKFFKAISDPEKVKEVGDNGATMAKTLYEKIFGPGSWAALQATSTLMPAKELNNHSL